MYNQNFYPYNYGFKNNYFSNIKHINWSNFLDKTQKTLGIINQAIPIIYQVKPIIKNAKTAFKVVNAFKKETNETKDIKDDKKDYTISSNSPTFFL